MRWRLAFPFAFLSALLLFGAGVNVWIYWSESTVGEKLFTIVLGTMFVVCLAVSVSIGVDRRIKTIPWLRMGIVVLLWIVSCQAAAIRDSF